MAELRLLVRRLKGAALQLEAQMLQALSGDGACSLRCENFDGAGDCCSMQHSEQGLLLLLLLQKHCQHLFSARPALRIHIHRLRAMQMQIPV